MTEGLLRHRDEPGASCLEQRVAALTKLAAEPASQHRQYHPRSIGVLYAF